MSYINLIATDGTSGRLLWNSELGHLKAGDQTILLTSRPYFTIKVIKLSPDNSLLALYGDNGITILEMPRKWVERYKNDQDSHIYCKTYNLNERLFTCDKRIKVTHVEWHPDWSRPMICILTNDNRLRFHDVIENTEIQSLNLRLATDNPDDDDGLYVGLSLAESAVCFDFGPAMMIQYEVTYPIYILMGTGDIMLVYTNSRNPAWAEHIIGPLKMLPQAEDNYGSDACSLIALDSSPPMLAIATPTGHIYHCFAFADRYTLLPPQTLYVYECIELRKDLMENPDDSYSPHVMKLLKDPTSGIRYFCVHQNGVHAIILPILDSLQSPSEIINYRESFAEFIFCTRTTTPSELNDSFESLSTPKGLGVEIRQTNVLLLVLMHDNELITQRIPPAATLITRRRFPRHSSGDIEILNVSQIDAARSNFLEQIELILKRKSTIPILKLSPDLEQADKISPLLKGIIVTFQEEYIKKYNLAVEAINKKFSILERDLENQKKEYDAILVKRKDIYSSILILYSKSGICRDNNSKISSRLDGLLSCLSSSGSLTEAEQKLKREISTLKEKVFDYRRQLDTIEAKHKYDMDRKEPLHKTNKDLILSNTQLNVIKDALSRHGADIAELKRFIKQANNQNKLNTTL